MGMLGLNTIPNARMDSKGTVRIGASTTDPYLHYFMGFQIAEPLYINLRQTAEISSLIHAEKRLYPGVDFKLRLMKDTRKRPELSFGVQSAFGHKRLSSEYLTFSKRLYNIDYTGGLAWGQLGSAGHIKNPLRGISAHFSKERDYSSEESQSFQNWFTGKEIGFFGGVEYFTPLKGLSIKADYGANRYVSEKNNFWIQSACSVELIA